MGLADDLMRVITGAEVAGFTAAASFRPAAGEGEWLSPPTFPPAAPGGSPYLFHDQWVDGERATVVALDQIPSQANRVEEVLLEARDGGSLQLPLMELTVSTPHGPIRLTSLEWPHRYADAYARDSLVDGVRFDKSPLGERLRSASQTDVRPLYEREPVSLVLGAWDSHRKGRWPRFPRLYQSRVYGVGPIEGNRRATRMDPLNLVGTIDDKTKAEGDWAFKGQGEKAKGGKLSEIGHGNIAPSLAAGGVSVQAIRRRASVSRAALLRVRFGDASAEAANTARAALLALAIAGDRLAFGGPSLWLRSGCDLVKLEERLGFELVGGEIQDISLDAEAAVEAFHELRDRATGLGIPMATDLTTLTPTPQLSEAINFAVASGPSED